MHKRVIGLIGIVGILVMLNTTMATAVAFMKGDVFAAVGNGTVKHYNSSGTLLEILDTGQGAVHTTGMAFDKNGSLYVTDFEGQNVSVFNNAGVLQGIFGSGYDRSPESILFDLAGNAYVGQPDGLRQILKFDSAGKLLTNYSPAVELRGTDWIDLANDQKTMYYTSEGNHIKRFDVSNNTQLSDFAALPNGSICYSLRIRPNTSGEVLVACSNSSYLLNGTGAILQTYPAPSGETLFALNLDPDNTSFWTGDLSATGKVHKIDIATGKELMNITTSSDSPIQELAGLAVFGELTAAKPPSQGSTTPNLCCNCCICINSCACSSSSISNSACNMPR